LIFLYFERCGGISQCQPTDADNIGSFTPKNGTGAKSAMGKDPKRIAARSDGVNDCEANDLGSRKEEDRGGTASTLGKVESGEEGGVRHGARMKPAASVAGFSL
jgi:hypothetical protein